ncbi:MAG: peptidase M24 [Desulfobulbus propionicus]|nr:MAG: peptidase M24 [Desulfobulbus propionicus]
MKNNIFQKRIEKLQRRLKRNKLDTILITQPENRRYLSGYSALDHGIQESSGVLLIPCSGKPCLLTDSRFILQAEEEAPDYQITNCAKGLLPTLKTLLGKLGAVNLAFESGYTLHSTADRLTQMAKKIHLRLKPVSGMVEEMRCLKSEQELSLLRESTRINEKVFQSVYNSIEPGMTEREIALAVELTMHEMGAERPSFDTIVAFGTNAAKPHAVPTDRALEAGDLVLIDMGLIYRGYCSDMTRTFVAGKPGDIFKARSRLVRKAQLAGIAAIKAGVTGAHVDKAARDIIKEGGFAKAFGHSLGHGVGLAVHEEPRLSSLSRKKLRAGMVVTVEPGMYLPEWGGVRLENMVIVQEDGCEVINNDTTFLDI